MTAVMHEPSASPAPTAASRRQRLPAVEPIAGQPQSEPVRLQPEAALAAIVGGAAAVVGLWWRDTPAIHGYGDWLTNTGRITGLLAGYAMVVLIVLMARIPPLERGIGADRLARWHAMGGRYAVSLVVVHATTITWGYAVTAHTNVVHQTATLLTSYPDVLVATVAGALLVGVGVSSARRARRRLEYETWFYLHLYTYLAVALAFSHQFATGAEFTSNRPARVLWAAMYVAAAAAIVWYRFVTPVRQLTRHRLRVELVAREAPGVVSILVTGRRLEELRADSGQFFRWRFLTPGLWWVSAPYSLSLPPDPRFLRITVKTLGAHSEALAQLRPGVRIMTEGPYGAMTSRLRRHRKTLLIAGGVGVTPLRALLQMPGDRGDVTMLYRVSSPDDVVLGEELRTIADRRGARLHIITGSRRELGHDPLSATALRNGVPGLADHDVFVCGPPAMADSVIAALRASGVTRRQIHHERFDF